MDRVDLEDLIEQVTALDIENLEGLLAINEDLGIAVSASLSEVISNLNELLNLLPEEE